MGLVVQTSDGQQLPSAPAKAEWQTLTPANFVTYGRLNLNPADIARAENMSRAQIGVYLRKPEFRKAYNHGRSQCQISIRAKVMSEALKEKPDPRMVIYAAKQFGGLGDEDEDKGVPESFDPTQNTWDSEFKDRLTELKQRFIDEPDGK